MKVNFKQIGLVAAVAAVSAGFVGNTIAQERAVGNIGDLAIVPYYTVQDDWVTGVHITNTAATTQVVKLRLRRATDSADALDFNLIMSPQDVWTGFLDDSSGNIVFATDDTTCTAPVRADGRFEMPAIYRAGAEEGYIEVISMGQPDSEAMPIATAAKHTAAGVPLDCAAVDDNFFANAPLDTSQIGNYNNAETAQAVPVATALVLQAAPTSLECYGQGGISPVIATDVTAHCVNTYNSEDNALVVSYFMRDGATGIEFGGNAVHIADFSGVTEPYMTNQETGIFSGDVYGFDYPDLEGGPWVGADVRTTLDGKYNLLRASTVLGVDAVINDWSIVTDRNVATDWIVTFPGQYNMIDTAAWLQNGFGAGCDVAENPATVELEGRSKCDFRDLPVLAVLDVWDREEQGEVAGAPGELVISPAPPGAAPDTTEFVNEVNVLDWTPIVDGTSASTVLGSVYNTQLDPSAKVGSDSGWARLTVSSAAAKTQQVCPRLASTNAADPGGVAYEPNTVATGRPICELAEGSVPMVGAVVWERSFPQNPEGNYGRLVDHSFESTVVVVPAP